MDIASPVRRPWNKGLIGAVLHTPPPIDRADAAVKVNADFVLGREDMQYAFEQAPIP